MQVHIFGAASSPCVANSILRRVADDNAKDFSPSVIAAIKRNFYVNDALSSENDEQSAIHLARGMVDVLARDSFNLTKFTSNSKEVLKTVPSDKLSIQNLNLDLEEPPVGRALGILWFVGDDTLGFKIRHLDRPETKRGILCTVCSLFDPLGFAAPVALAVRGLVQDLWKANVGWDEPLGEVEVEEESTTFLVAVAYSAILFSARQRPARLYVAAPCLFICIRSWVWCITLSAS